MKNLFIFAGILLFGFVSIANADSFRCGDSVVSTGDSKMEVLSKCGPPDYEETVSYKTSGSVSSGGSVSLNTQPVDKLSYNCGDRRFIRVLTFRNGKLTRIENSGYGSGPEKCN